jgi:hypothetical protein
MAAKKLTDILAEDPGERFTLAFYDFRKVIEGALRQLPGGLRGKLVCPGRGLGQPAPTLRPAKLARGRGA